jgi:hypothetical protein
MAHRSSPKPDISKFLLIETKFLSSSAGKFSISGAIAKVKNDDHENPLRQ